MARKYPEYKQLNLPEINKQIQEYWKENKIFEKSISSREGKQAYTFYEGPPSANGMPGIHHVMARAIKDIFCRFKTLDGYQVKRKAGWDTHGLPVELGVEKELGITKEDIGEKISVKDYNEACKKAVMRYTDSWNELTEKMGYWVDMDDPYITYKPKYMETVWWLLKQMWDKGLVYKGYTIQPFSPKAGTGLSSHELNMPGCYRDVKDTSAIAQFPLQRDDRAQQTFGGAIDLSDKVYFLAWTTTPWTLPSNTALTVGRDILYVMVETFNRYTNEPQKLLLAQNLVGKYFKEDQKNQPLEDYDFKGKNIPWRIVWEGRGEDLLELRYEQLLPYAQPYENPENAFRVIPGDFVTTEDGTGIVHTAPTFGADDARVAKEASPEVPPMLVLDDNNNPVPLVDMQGRFRPEMGEFAGKYVKNEYYDDGQAPEKSMDVEIAIKLKEENKAFLVEKYEHSYPHCWRTDKPILYYPLNSWFVKVTARRERLVELNKEINWKPKSTGEGRFGNWLENANDWNLSRSRYWGIPLPIWSTETGSERKIFGSIEELKAACDEAVEAGFMESHPLADFEPGNLSEENYNTVDLHRHIVDEIVLKSSTGEPMHREPDLIDVWFDSGSMPYAQWHYPFEPLPDYVSTTPNYNGGQSPDPSESQKDKPGGHHEPEAPLGGLGAQTQPPKWQTANPEIYEVLKERAKELRQNETEAEKKLWNELQNKKLGGYKFRRQHIIDQYIVDFVCLSKQLIVEVDGGYHIPKDQRQSDEKRMNDLEQYGFRILRFTNHEVEEDLSSVADKVLLALKKTPLRGSGSSDSIKEFYSASQKSPLTPKGGTGQPKSQNPESVDGGKPGPSESQKDKPGGHHEPPAPLGGLGAQNSQRESFPEKSPLTPKGGTGQPKSQNPESADSGKPDPSESQKNKLGGHHEPEAPTSAGSARAGDMGAAHQGIQDITKSPVFPADFIAEGVDQTRGWFYTLHTIAGLVFDSVAYKNVVSNGLVLDKNGQKMSKRLGNAVDPFETIEKYGSDAVRWYMISNAQPWDNLKFDLQGVAEVQRRFFGTLYNTYSFYALYANIDEFVWDSANLTKVEDRPELDRWIISRLQVLKEKVHFHLNDYEPTRAARAMMEFVDDELSNWYVRLCRRRFWKGEMNRDKRMAYETLYECLYVMSQLMSPIAPFFADWLYQNLTDPLDRDNEEESVHLTYLSEAKHVLVDEMLNERMKMAQRLSSMVLSLRKKETIKVRQPLQKMMVPALKEEVVDIIESVKDIVLSEVNVKELQILRDVSGVLVKRIKPDFKKLGPRFGKIMKKIAAEVNQFSQEDIQQLETHGAYELEIDGEPITITPDDVQISTEDIPGWLVLTEGDLTVALDISITEDLRYEGIARELINRIQNLRKDSGLEVTDHISLKVQRSSEVEEALKRNKNYVAEETLARELELSDHLDDGHAVEFDGISTKIYLEKV